MEESNNKTNSCFQCCREMNLTIETVTESCTACIQKHSTFTKKVETKEGIDLNGGERKQGSRGKEWENKGRQGKIEESKGKETETSVRHFQKRGRRMRESVNSITWCGGHDAKLC